MKKRFIPFCAAGALLCMTLLSGCASLLLPEEEAPTPTPTATPSVWLMEPRVDVIWIEPIYDQGTEGMPREGYEDWFLAGQDGSWYFLNAATGEWLSGMELTERPVYCGMGHLYPLAQNYDYAADAPRWDAALRVAGAPFVMEVGHGGAHSVWVQDPDSGELYTYVTSEGSEENVAAADMDFETFNLVGVRRGEWVTSELSGEEILCPVADSLWAVGCQDGTLQTDFVYQNAVLGTENTIAVQDPSNGLWGYCNAKGAIIAPCNYLTQWGITQTLDPAGQPVMLSPAYPAQEISGTIVLLDANRRYSLIDDTGRQLIGPDVYEALAPAKTGCVWAKKDGLWGLLKL